MTDEKCKNGECPEGCDCGDDENFITLEFDDGESVECEIMGVFEFEEKEYIALMPADGSDDVYIYGYKEMEDEFELIDIEDEDEFDRVVAEFEKMSLEEDEEEA